MTNGTAERDPAPHPLVVLCALAALGLSFWAGPAAIRVGSIAILLTLAIGIRRYRLRNAPARVLRRFYTGSLLAAGTVFLPNREGLVGWGGVVSCLSVAFLLVAVLLLFLPTRGKAEG